MHLSAGMPHLKATEARIIRLIVAETLPEKLILRLLEQTEESLPVAGLLQEVLVRCGTPCVIHCVSPWQRGAV